MLYQVVAAHYLPFLLICMAHTHQVTSVNALYQNAISVEKRSSRKKKKKMDKINICLSSLKIHTQTILHYKYLSL